MRFWSNDRDDRDDAPRQPTRILLERTSRIMSQLDDLTTGLTDLQSSVNAAAQRTASDLDALKAEIAAQQSAATPDLSGALAQVDAIKASVTGIDPAPPADVPGAPPAPTAGP